MVTDAIEQVSRDVPVVSADVSRLSDQAFSRIAMRSGIERLEITFDELLRRVSSRKKAI